MLPPRCFSCGKPLAQLQIPWEKGIENIKKQNLDETSEHAERRKLMNDLGANRYCCRGQLMGYIDMVKLVN